MADINPNIEINIDTSSAMSSIKALQGQISAFHQQLRATGDAANKVTSTNNAKNLMNSVNATGKFSASLTNVSSAADTFTDSLERNKLSMGQYFKYGAAASGKFGKAFRSEFSTIEQVTRERVKTLQTQFIRLGKDANGAIETIKVRPLRLDMQNLGTQVMMNSQKQQIFNKLLQQGSTQLLNFGKNTQWAGRQLMVGFTIPLSILGSTTIKAFMEMEEAVIKFRRVYGELNTTVSQTDSMVNNIEALAKSFTKYGVAIKDTMELAAEAAAMGKMGADLTAQVSEATRLAVLGGVSQSEALKTTISLQNTLGISTENLASKIDFLNSVENQTVVSIEDLTTAIPKAGPVVQQLGGNVEDLAFFLTAMKEGGINASEGANALKSGLASLINPSKAASEMLAGYGINVKAIVEGNAGDIKGTVLGFAGALDTLDPLNRARAIEQMFGKFQFARISTLFKNVVDEGSQAARVLELTQATTQELAILSERELKRVEDSPAYKFKKAIEDIKNELVPLGAEFLKLITPIIEFAKGLLQQFNNMDSGVKSFVMGLIGVLGLIAPVAIMTFGLMANGLANLIKGFGFINNMFGRIAGVSTNAAGSMGYFTQAQLEAAAVASSLGQVHSNLVQTFTLEKGALDALALAYRQAATAAGLLASVPVIPRISAPIIIKSPTGRRASSPGGVLPPTVPGYAKGILSLPGPKGAGDILPAMLAPGESVIPAKQSTKHRGLLEAIMNDSVPGFARGVVSLGMPGSGKSTMKNRTAAEEIYALFLQSSFANVPPKNYGHQLSPTTGHSFPIFGLGGVYASPTGGKVFVKPVMDEAAAKAEMRGTQIARQAHGLKAPEQKIVVIRDPQDVTGQRRFLALESKLDSTFVNNDPMAIFNEDQYFKQLTASLLRVDKDLSPGNLFGNVVADVGPAGVFTRASGLRAVTSDLPSMEEQATINLLGIKGGAKRAFAESTVGLMAGLTPELYHQRMIAEIQTVLPLLKKTVAGFGIVNPAEAEAYTGMIKRLEQGLTVDWSKFHEMHSAVKIAAPKTPKVPKVAKVPGFEDGVFNLAGPRGAGDILPAMLAPGETVISAKRTSKYAPLLKSIIADNVPGFEDGTAQEELARYYENASKPTNRRTKNPVKSSSEISAVMGEGEGDKATLELLKAKVSPGTITKLLADASREAAKGAENIKAYLEELNSQIAAAVDNEKNKVQKSPALLKSVREATGTVPTPKGDAFSHIGSGKRTTVREVLEDHESGKIKLSPSELEQMQKLPPDRGASVKSGLGMSLDAKTNQNLARTTGAKKEDLLNAFDESGSEKWNQAVKNGGGNAEELAESLEVLNAKVRENIKNSKDDVVFDSQEQADAFNNNPKNKGKTAASVERMYADSRQSLLEEGGHDQLINVLDTAQATPTEIRPDGVGSLGGRAGKKIISGDKGIDAGLLEVAKKEQSNVSSKNKNVSLDGMEKFEELAKEAGEDTADGFILGIKERAQISSPSKKTYEQGTDLVDGFTNGIDDASDRLGPPPTNGFDDTESQTQFQPPPPPMSRKERVTAKLSSLAESAKGSVSQGVSSVGTKIADAVENGPIGKKIAAALNDGTQVVTNRKGEVMFDPSRREDYDRLSASQKEGIPVPDLEAMDYDTAMSEASNMAVDENGNIILGKNGNPISRKNYEKSISKQASAQKRQKIAGKAFGALGTATMVAGMASGTEGPVGDIARQAMPILGTLSMIGPILLSLAAPIAILVGVVGLVAFGLYKWNETIEASRKEGRELGNALSMSTDKLLNLSKALGKVSATEVRTRAQSDQVAGSTESQRKFGMTFLESDAGKSMIEDVSALSKSGLSLNEVSGSVARQISLAIFQGILSPQEANSVIAALGAEMKDYNFSADIQGSLISLIGPNGEDIAKDPLQVSLEIQSAGDKQVADFAKLVGERFSSEFSLFDNMMLNTGASSDFEGLSASDQVSAKQQISRDDQYGRGGISGFFAGVGSLLTPISDEVESYMNTYSGTIMADATALQSAAVQVGINQIAENQQILDALESQYEQKRVSLEKDLASEKSAGKRKSLEQQIADLQKQRIAGVGELNAANAATMEQIIGLKDQYKDTKAFDKAISASVLANFEEGDPLKVFAEETTKALEAMPDTEFKATLQLSYASGSLSFSNVQDLINLFDKDPEIGVKFSTIIADVGASNGSQLMTLLANAKVGENMSTALDLFLNLDSEEFDAKLEALAKISNLKIKYGVDIDITGDNLDVKLNAVTNAIAALDGQPDVITKDVLMSLPGAEQFAALVANWDTLTEGGKTITLTAILDFVASSSGLDKDLVNRYIQETGMPAQVFRESGPNAGLAPRKRTDEELQALMPNATAHFQALGNATNLNLIGEDDPKDPTGGGAKADPFENILNRLKQVRNSAIDATGGLKELKRVLGGMKDITIFKGTDQKLIESGYGKKFIDYINGLDEETRKAFVKVSKNGVLAVTAAGKAMNKALSEETLGDFNVEQLQTVANINNQFKAIDKLQKSKLSLTDATNIAQDAELAYAIATAKTTKEIDILVTGFKEAEKKRRELAAFTKFANFFGDQKKAVEDTNNQFAAIKKLVAAGMSLAEATKVAADAEVAFSVVHQQSSKQLEKLANDYKTAEKAKKDFAAATKFANFQETQKNTVLEIQDQISAIIKLTAAGLSLAQATDIASDAELAYSIQTQKTAEEIRVLAEEFKAAEIAKEKLAGRVSFGKFEFTQKSTLKDVNNQFKAVSKLVAAGLTLQQATLVAADAELAYSIATQQTSKTLNQLVIDFKAAEKAKRNFALATPEGRVEEFDKVSSLIAEVFTQREAVVEIRFEKDSKSYNDIIKQAQQEIEDNQLILDDYNYALTQVANEEEEINDKYDKRVKALEQIYKVNSDLAQLQKSQLSVAEALATGDIAAAARAMQELRDTRAQKAKQDQLDAIEASKKAELESIQVTFNKWDLATQKMIAVTMTRANLEEEIKSINEAIAKIEEDRLEPAQRMVVELERARDIALEAIGEAGYLTKTKQQWIDVQNEIKQAAVETEKYNKAIIDGLTDVAGITVTRDKDGNTTAIDINKDVLLADSVAPAGEYPAADPAPQYPGSSPASPNADKPTSPVPNNTNSSYAVMQNAQQGLYGETSAPVSKDSGVRSRELADAAAYNAVHAGGVKAGGAVITGTSTKDFAENLKDVQLANRAIANNPSSTPAEIKAAKNQNIALINATGIKFAKGGLVPKYFVSGGKFKGPDTVPAMLTPGEFVIKRSAVNNYGIDRLKAINNGTSSSEAVYNNYEVNVSVKSDANPDQIANAVMSKIRQVDSKSIRKNRF